MKLEYVPDGAIDTPLIRLYDFDEAQAAQLRSLAAELASGLCDEARVHGLEEVEAIGGCQLTFKVGPRDEGVGGGPTTFTCALRRETWEQVAQLIEPFCELARPGTFQYLDDTSGTTLLLSVDGRW
jgi:hypothetical protein